MENWVTIVSLIVNFLAGGGVLVFFTLKPSIKKAGAEAERMAAEAKTVEIDNEEKAIDIYKGLAEDLRKELINSKSNYTEVLTEMANLRKEVVKLTNVNKQMVKLLDKITPDNLTEMIDKIKKIHDNE